LDLHAAKLEKVRRLQEESLRTYEPNPVQLLFHKSTASIRGLFAANQSGKSWAANNELAWTVGKVHPYRPNKSGPVFGRVCYQDVGVIEAVAIPTFKRILPRKECVLEGKTFEGNERRWPGLKDGDFDKAYDKQFHVIWLADGSFIEIKTYQQDLQSYAGPPRDIISHDEEPPEKVYQENLARQVTRGVNILFAMTPLNYSQWLYSDIYMKASTSDNIDVFTMSAYDNPTADVKALKELEASITDPAIRAARMYGKFTYLEGLVWKEYGNHNFIEPFSVSERWHKSVVIDPHPAKDTAVNWFAEDLDGKIYCYREASLKGSVEEVCSEIKGLCGGEDIDDVYIDPAAKGQKTNWGGDTILFKFQEAFPCIMLANNNVTGGIDKVRDMCRDKIGSGPKFFIMKNCPNTDWQMRNFSWAAPTKSGEDRAKPKVIKRNDDHCDNVRYRCMASFSHRNEDAFKGFGIRGYAS